MAGTIIKKIDKVILIVITGLMILGLVISLQQKNIYMGLLVPHHLLVEQNIAAAYDKTLDQFDKMEKKFDTIIILSPNHFNAGFRYIQSTDNAGNNAENDKISQLANSGTLYIEPKSFEREHGIFNQYKFISQYFADAKIIPVIIKADTPRDKLDTLVSSLLKLKTGRTLIIASIDFSHYVNEKTALKNDGAIIDFLSDPFSTPDLFAKSRELAKSANMDTPDSIAMDSPETFYTFLSVLQKTGTNNIEILNRTSSASITGISDPMQNTSHIYALFRQ